MLVLIFLSFEAVLYVLAKQTPYNLLSLVCVAREARRAAEKNGLFFFLSSSDTNEAN